MQRLDPALVTDRTMLDSYSASGGVGIRIGEFYIQKAEGERPIQLLERARGEYSAWYASENAKEVSAARAREAAAREASGGSIIYPAGSSAASQPAVQDVQAGLEASLKSQVASLREKLDAYVKEYDQLIEEQEHYRRLARECERDLNLAEKFLKEIQEGERTSQVPSKTGRDIHSQVGQRKPRRSRRVGSEGSTEVRSEGSEGADAQDQGRADAAG